MTGVRTPAGEELERRLDAVGWGVLLPHSGIFLVSAPWEAWLVGVGKAAADVQQLIAGTFMRRATRRTGGPEMAVAPSHAAVVLSATR